MLLSVKSSSERLRELHITSSLKLNIMEALQALLHWYFIISSVPWSYFSFLLLVLPLPQLGYGFAHVHHISNSQGIVCLFWPDEPQICLGFKGNILLVWNTDENHPCKIQKHSKLDETKQNCPTERIWNYCWVFPLKSWTPGNAILRLKQCFQSSSRTWGEQEDMPAHDWLLQRCKRHRDDSCSYLNTN